MPFKKIVLFSVLLCLIVAVLSSKSKILSSVGKSDDKSLENVEVGAAAILKNNSFLDKRIYESFEQSQLEIEGLSYKVYREAYIGFLNLKHLKKIPMTSNVLSVVDFTLSSKKKRLWIIDLSMNKLLLNTWVAHGKGSGQEFPTQFSNTPNSHQSSLGFYVTGEIYYGKNGRSMKLDGLDEGFNTKVRERYIVMHGAEYVSADTIQHLNMLGQSEGCPAVSMDISNHVIDLTKNKSVIYIYANVREYQSKYLQEEIAEKILTES